MKRDEDTGENCTNEAVQIYTTKNATNTKRRRRTNQRRPKSKIGGIDDAHEQPAAAACGENKEHCPSEKRRRIDNGCDNGQMILPIEERAERKSNPNRN